MKFAFILFFAWGAALAGTLDEDAAGRGNLRSLLQHEPLYILTPRYKGHVSLVYHRGPRAKDAPPQRELHFTAFTTDGSRYGEPDCPMPKLKAVVEAVPLAGHGFGTGVFAFADSAPSIERLFGCKTLKDLRQAVPDLVRVFSEDDDHPGYWFNWFHLGDDGQLGVVLLSAGDAADGKLTRMELWTGTIPPSK